MFASPKDPVERKFDTAIKNIPVNIILIRMDGTKLRGKVLNKNWKKKKNIKVKFLETFLLRIICGLLNFSWKLWTASGRFY